MKTGTTFKAVNLNIQKAHKGVFKSSGKNENILLPAPIHSGMFLHVLCRSISFLKI